MTRHATIVSALSTALLLALAGCGAGSPEAAGADESNPSQSAPGEASTAASADASAPTLGPSAASPGQEMDMGWDDLAMNGSEKGIVVAEPSDGGPAGARVQVLDTDRMTLEVFGQFGVGLPSFTNEFSDYPTEVRGRFGSNYTRLAGWFGESFGWYTPFDEFDEFVDVRAAVQAESDEFGRGSVYSGGSFDGEGDYYFSKSLASDDGYKEKIEEVYMIPVGGEPADAKPIGLPAGQTGVKFEVDEHGRVDLCDPLCGRWRSNQGGEEGGLVADWISETEFLTLGASRGMVFRDVVAPDGTGIGPTDTQEPILPETEREVYSPVVSPDGTQFAFLSPSTEYVGMEEVFIGPLDASAARKKTGTMLPEGARLADWL